MTLPTGEILTDPRQQKSVFLLQRGDDSFDDISAASGSTAPMPTAPFCRWTSTTMGYPRWSQQAGSTKTHPICVYGEHRADADGASRCESPGRRKLGGWSTTIQGQTRRHPLMLGAAFQRLSRDQHRPARRRANRRSARGLGRRQRGSLDRRATRAGGRRAPLTGVARSRAAKHPRPRTQTGVRDPTVVPRPEDYCRVTTAPLTKVSGRASGVHMLLSSGRAPNDSSVPSSLSFTMS